jgi:hypothetical protein
VFDKEISRDLNYCYIFRRQEFDLGNSNKSSFASGSFRRKLPQVRAASLALHQAERQAPSSVMQLLTQHRVTYYCTAENFEVLDSVAAKITVFWNMTLSSLVDNYQSFGEISSHHFHGRRELTYFLTYVTHSNSQNCLTAYYWFRNQ